MLQDRCRIARAARYDHQTSLQKCVSKFEAVARERTFDAVKAFVKSRLCKPWIGLRILLCENRFRRSIRASCKLTVKLLCACLQRIEHELRVFHLFHERLLQLGDARRQCGK